MSQVARARLDLWVVKFPYWPAIFFFQVGLRTERLTQNQTNLRLQKLEQRLTLAEKIQVSTMSYTQARVNQLSRKGTTVHLLYELQLKHNCKVAQREKDPRITKTINRLIK